jgi:hypothetical protein
MAATDKAELPRGAAEVMADTTIFAPWAFLRSLDAISRSTQAQLAWTVPGGRLALEKRPDFRATARAGVGVRGAALGLGMTGLRIDVERASPKP